MLKPEPLTMVVPCILMGALLAQPAHGATQTHDDEAFVIAIDAAESAHVGEPLALRIQIDAADPLPYEATKPAGPDDLNVLEVHIKLPGRSDFEYMTPAQLALTERRPQDLLAPGESYSIRCWLIASGKIGNAQNPGPLLRHPGTYELFLRLRTGKRNEAGDHVAALYDSNIIRVEVSAPEGEAAEARTLWHEALSDINVFWQIDLLMPSNPTLAQLVAEYPETPYAAYAMFFMAHTKHLGASSEWDGETNSPEYYASLLETVLAEHPDFPFRQDAAYYLAHRYWEQDRNAEARALIENILEDPDSTYIAEKARESLGVAE